VGLPLSFKNIVIVVDEQKGGCLGNIVFEILRLLLANEGKE